MLTRAARAHAAVVGVSGNMRIRLRLQLVTGLLAVAAPMFPIAPAPLMAQHTPLVEFELEDQFDRTWTEADVAGRAGVFVVADRGGSEWAELWGETLADSLGPSIDRDEVALMAVAHAAGVPFFLKGMVRGSLSDDPEAWVLIDWNGHFARHYPFAAGRANLLVFSAAGDLVLHEAVRAIDAETLTRVLECARDTPGTCDAPGTRDTRDTRDTPGNRDTRDTPGARGTPVTLDTPTHPTNGSAP